MVRYLLPLTFRRYPCPDVSLFVGDDEGGVDQYAMTEMFMVVGGLSTVALAMSFNVPYIVAPSVLYAPREPGCVCIARETYASVGTKYAIIRAGVTPLSHARTMCGGSLGIFRQMPLILD